MPVPEPVATDQANTVLDRKRDCIGEQTEKVGSTRPFRKGSLFYQYRRDDMYKLLVVIANKAGLTSQVISFESEHLRNEAADALKARAAYLGEMEIVFL